MNFRTRKNQYNRRTPNPNGGSGLTNTVRKRKRINRRPIITTSLLPPIVQKNLMSQVKRLTLKVPDVINSVSGSTGVTFGLSANDFLNLSSILTVSSPFNDQVNRYTFWRITSVKLEVQRTLAESQISTVYANGEMPSLFLQFMPYFTSTTITGSALIQSSTSFEVDPYITERQRVNYSYSPTLCWNNVGTSLASSYMYGMWNALSTSFGNMPGQIAINSANITNALITKQLYIVTIYIDCEFAGDFGN